MFKKEKKPVGGDPTSRLKIPSALFLPVSSPPTRYHGFRSHFYHTQVCSRSWPEAVFLELVLLVLITVLRLPSL